MSRFRNIALFFALLLLVLVQVAQGQSRIPTEYRGDQEFTARGVMDANLIQTNYRNHGELARFGDNPWGNWPRGIGGRHIDGIGVAVAGVVQGEREKWSEFYGEGPDPELNPVIFHYRSAGTRIGFDGIIYGWNALPGFFNTERLNRITDTLDPIPALSSDNSSWPGFWPDRLSNPDDPGWPGQWNGLFGKGILNADLESYYVMDDGRDYEYALNPQTGVPLSPKGVFYPNPSDSTYGGLGLQAQVRLLQWANVLAEDTMFLLYRLTNIGQYNHDRLYFAQLQDYGLGGEEGDESAAFDPQQDIAFGFDQDGLGTRSSGGSYRLGHTGFAFLESPARGFDGQDNDEDGITDESRFNVPGMLIEGQAAIREFVESNYNIDVFEQFNGTLESRPAYQAGRWWTADENLDWVGFEDENGNGLYDPGELAFNDVGLDGLGPFDLGYPGPDTGEGNGMPEQGEPNFGELDVDESDQIGLTGFDLAARPFYENGDNLRDDDWMWDRFINIAEPNIILGETVGEVLVADVEPFLVFTSGPVQLPAQTTDFFSTAWLFGADLDDFLRNRVTVQKIYNADYNFAQPPILPRLNAVAGDGKVTLSWDTTSVVSFDRFLQEFDFEGYRLYKGTDNLLSDARTVTNVFGTPTFLKPIAQWDLKNEIVGIRSVFNNEASFEMGNDTGLQYHYVDTDVENGVTYYYALVAYDRGFVDPTGNGQESIDPQENTFFISLDLSGQVNGTSPNAAVVVPRSNAAGFVEGATNEDLSKPTQGVGTGSLDVLITDPNSINTESIYQVNIFSTPSNASDIFRTSHYEVLDIATNRTLIERSPIVPTSPVIDNVFTLSVNTIVGTQVDFDRTGYAIGEGENAFFSTNALEVSEMSSDYDTNWIPEFVDNPAPSFTDHPFDYELVWVNPADSLYTPPFGGIGSFLLEDIPIYAFNRTTGESVDLIIIDENDTDQFDVGDAVIFYEGTKFRHRVRFSLAEGETESNPPDPGARLVFSQLRPLGDGDFFQFTLRGNGIDMEDATNELDEVGVVPNPYVAGSRFEPRDQIVGRGERRVQFINLPQTCIIRIYNLRGELIRTLDHQGFAGDGAVFWDLKTEGGQDLAYGVYIYHVEAPGIGETTGKVAIVK